jgi:hypothetical protein
MGWMKDEKLMTSNSTPNSSAPLGDHLGTFAPSLPSVIAGFILSAVMVVGGAGAAIAALYAAHRAEWKLPFKVDHGWCWFAVGLMVLFGVGFLIGGVSLMRRSKRLISFRADFFDGGFRRRFRGIVDVVLWADVACVRKTNRYQKLPLVKSSEEAFMPSVASSCYTVVMKSGKTIVFSGNDVQPLHRFGQLLITQAAARSVPCEVVEERA